MGKFIYRTVVCAALVLGGLGCQNGRSITTPAQNVVYPSDGKTNHGGLVRGESFLVNVFGFLGMGLISPIFTTRHYVLHTNLETGVSQPIFVDGASASRQPMGIDRIHMMRRALLLAASDSRRVYVAALASRTKTVMEMPGTGEDYHTMARALPLELVEINVYMAESGWCIGTWTFPVPAEAAVNEPEAWLYENFHVLENGFEVAGLTWTFDGEKVTGQPKDKSVKKRETSGMLFLPI